MSKWTFLLLTSVVLLSNTLSAQTYKELCLSGDKKYSEGNYISAIKDYEAAMKINAKISYPYYVIGIIYRDIEKNDTKAISYFQKALAIDPKDCESRNYLFNLYLKKKQYKQIKTMCSNVLKLAEPCPSIFQYYAIALWKSGENMKASEYFSKAVIANFDDAQTYRNVGLFYADLGKTHESLNYLTKALKLGDTLSAIAIVEIFHKNYPSIFMRLDHDIKHPINQYVFAAMYVALHETLRHTKGLSDPEVLPLIIQHFKNVYRNLTPTALKTAFNSLEVEEIDMLNNFTDDELEFFSLLAAHYLNR